MSQTETVSIDFSKQSEAQNPNWDVPADSQQALIPRPAAELAKIYRTDEDSVGEWDDDDVRIPQIQIIHPTDERAKKRQFQSGDFVYHGQAVLQQPMALVAIKKRKRYTEIIDKKKEGEKRRPRIVETAQEVKNLGGFLGYKNECPPNVQLWGDMADVLVVFGQRNNDSGLFPFEFEGEFWCPAQYRVKSTAYGRFAIALETAKKTFLREGLIFGRWTLEAYLDTSMQEPTFVPKLMWQRKNSPEFIKFLRELTEGLA